MDDRFVRTHSVMGGLMIGIECALKQSFENVADGRGEARKSEVGATRSVSIL